MLIISFLSTKLFISQRDALNMKSLYTVIFACFLIPVNLSSQVLIKEEPSVARLMNDFVYTNQQKETIKGWRIQIITTNDRRQSENAKARFSRIYPDIHVKWKQEVPFYKVQVGAYETKEELQAFLQEIKTDFPAAIPIVDDVRIDELAF